jgi:hypothetical protein
MFAEIPPLYPPGGNEMTEPRTYTSVLHEVRLLRWPEATAADLAALLGAENVNVIPGGVQVRNADAEWFTLGDGFAAGVRDDGSRVIKSPAALSADYR